MSYMSAGRKIQYRHITYKIPHIARITPHIDSLIAWVRPLSMLAVSMLDMALTTCSLREAVCRRRGCLWRVLRELQSTELRALIRLMNASKCLRRGGGVALCVCT